MKHARIETIVIDDPQHTGPPIACAAGLIVSKIEKAGIMSVGVYVCLIRGQQDLIGHRGGRLALECCPVGIKHALEYGQKGTGRLTVIDRRTEDEGICTVHFRGYSVANVIVERTRSGSVLATSAADAATQRLVAYPRYLAIDAVHRKLLRNL